MSDNGSFRTRIVEIHDYKSLMGPCFITFSIPLLVPGISLTLVGIYSDSDVFPLFGGWHVTGIVFLAVAVILLISGIVLRCVFKPVISPDVEQHLSPTPSLLGKCNKAYEHDKRLETVNGIYKNPNLKSVHSAHKLVSTNHKDSRTAERTSSPKPSNSNNDVDDTQINRQSTRRKRQSEARVAPALNREKRSDRSDHQSDTDSSLDRRRSRGNSRRSRSSDVESDTPLNPHLSYSDARKYAHLSKGKDSSDSGPPPYEYSSQRVKKKRTVSKTPSFGLDKQSIQQTSSKTKTVEGPNGEMTSSSIRTRTSVTSDKGSIVTVTSGNISDQQGMEQSTSDAERHQKQRKRRRRKKRRPRQDGSDKEASGHENEDGTTGLPELRVKPKISNADHQGKLHHVDFSFGTDDTPQEGVALSESRNIYHSTDHDVCDDTVVPRSSLHRRRSSESDV